MAGKTWLSIAEKAETVGMDRYTQKDADIFNSYPFKFLCEKVDHLDEQLEAIRLALQFLAISTDKRDQATEMERFNDGNVNKNPIGMSGR